MCVTSTKRAILMVIIGSILLFSGSLTSCGDDDDGVANKPPSASLNKIMPLGASRVEGARPEYESYRYEL